MKFDDERNIFWEARIEEIMKIFWERRIEEFMKIKSLQNEKFE